MTETILKFLILQEEIRKLLDFQNKQKKVNGQLKKIFLLTFFCKYLHPQTTTGSSTNQGTFHDSV